LQIEGCGEQFVRNSYFSENSHSFVVH